jgi:hypothetical protein
LGRVVHQGHFRSLRQIMQLWNNMIGTNLSIHTARRRLYTMLIFSRIARCKPAIGLINRQRRIRWCTRVMNWTVQDNWHLLLYSDEVCFNLAFDDGRVRV